MRSFVLLISQIGCHAHPLDRARDQSGFQLQVSPMCSGTRWASSASFARRPASRYLLMSLNVINTASPLLFLITPPHHCNERRSILAARSAGRPMQQLLCRALYFLRSEVDQSTPACTAATHGWQSQKILHPNSSPTAAWTSAQTSTLGKSSILAGGKPHALAKCVPVSSETTDAQPFRPVRESVPSTRKPSL